MKAIKIIGVVILVVVVLAALVAALGSSIGGMTDQIMSASSSTSASLDPGIMSNSAGVPRATAMMEEMYDEMYAPLEPTEEYDFTEESPFKSVSTSPLSTFSSDVDTASYSNMRRFINNGQEPMGVRIEELVNYFDYDYRLPEQGEEHPFSITTELGKCPWNEERVLAMIGIQGMKYEDTSEIDNNIVFLLDVSGSMDEPNKLPLLQESFILLLDSLKESDTISIVTYAGSDRVLADSVSCKEKSKLKKIMRDLSAGGSTAGSKGLETAYRLAEKNFIEGGNNRIILATDGDFNVGPSSVEDLTDMVKLNRAKGIYISVLGFGMYNLKDNMMESIADNGNGNYAYIDTISEAEKVLVDEFDSTMFTIANDLKIQVEFNPNVVSEYRLIGYNNRRLENEDFNDDKKDAGDVGAGHSVTAFYELIPVGGDSASSVDDLIFSQNVSSERDEWMNVKVRYKRPGEDTSILTEQLVGSDLYKETNSRDFIYASAVAEFGLILTDSDYKGSSSISSVMERAVNGKGEDKYNLREEFIELVEKYKSIVE